MKKEIKKGKMVYDENGQCYCFEEKLENGYLVTELFSVVNDYGESETETGKKIFLNKVYSEPPTLMYERKIETLKARIEELQQEFIKKLEQINTIENKEPDELLKEKLKKIPNSEKLIEILSGKCKLYNIDQNSNKIIEVSAVVVGIDLKTKEICVFRRNDYQDDYFRENIKTSLQYFSLEEAEIAVVNRILKGYSNTPYLYKDVLEIDKLFDKYNKKRTDTWIVRVKQRKEEEEKKLKDNIYSAKRDIENAEKRIIEYNEKLTLLEAEK